MDQRGVPRAGRCDIGAYEYMAGGPADKIYALDGTPQSTKLNTRFPFPLQILLLDDIGSPVTNAAVVVEAPAVGASCIFTDSGTFTTTMMTNESGIAVSAPFVANASAGKYWVTATSGGVTMPAHFMLSNIGRVFFPVVARNYCPDFFDDFSNPATGWAVGEDSYVRAEYLNGEYRVLSKRGGYLYLFRAPTCDRENYTVEADARWHGTTGNSYGLIFGLTSDFSQYLLFDINTDYRMFRLYHRGPGGFSEIVAPTNSSAINGGAASNHIKITRIGYSILVEVNGTVLVNQPYYGISGFTGVGLVSSAYSDGPAADARFDNFGVVSHVDATATGQQTSRNTVDNPESADFDLKTEFSPMGWYVIDSAVVGWPPAAEPR